MALTVGELVAYIRADGTQFDRSVDDAGRKFDRLRSTISSGTKVIAGAVTGVAIAAAGVGAAVFKVGADYNRLQQNSRAALRTLLGSAEAAADQMDRLDDFARNSPFAKQIFITAQQQLLGFGVEAERVVPILDAVQNAVASVGGSNEQVAQVTYALAQMQGQGKLTGETLNQLGQYGIDAATVVGEKMGMTGAEIREMASKPGGIPVDQIWDPLVDGLMERFGGATANIKEEFDGAFDRIKGAWRDIGSIIAAPFIDPMGGGRAVGWANAFADAMRALEQKAKPLVDLLIARFAPGLDRISPALDKARSAINAWDLRRVNTQLDETARYAPLIGATGAALMAFGGPALLGPLGRFVPAMHPVVAGLLGLIATSPGLRETGRNLMDALAPLAPVVSHLGRTLADTLLGALDETTPALGAMLEAVAPLIVAVGTGLAPAFVTLIQAAEPVITVVAQLVEWFAGLPDPVIAGTLALAGLIALRGPITAMVTTLSTQVQILGQRMQVQAALAQMSGTQLGTMGAAAAVARTSVSGLGTALKGAFISNPVGLVITGVATAIGFLVTRQMEAQEAARQHRDRVSELADALVRTNGAIDESIRATTAKKLSDEGAFDAARQLGINLNDVVDAALGNEEAIARVTAVTEAAIAPAKAFGEAAREGGEITETLTLAQLEQADAGRTLNEVIGESAVVTEDAKQVAKDLAAVRRDGTSAAEGEKRAIDELVRARRDEQGATMSQREAEIRWTESLREARNAAKEGTEVVRDKEGALKSSAKATIEADKELLNLARSSDTLIESMRRNNATAEELDETLEEQREQFLKVAERMGFTGQEAKDLADAYGLIPDEVITEIKAEAEAAQKVIDRFIKDNTGRTIKVRIDATGQPTYSLPGTNVPSWQADGSVLEFYARGGIRENHVAQIAPAGTTRVWNEPETGGEAYIPLALSKRARSREILDEVANRFGFELLPRGARRFRDGGVDNQAASPATGATINVTVQANEPLAEAYAQNVARQIDTRMRDHLAANGLTTTMLGG